MKLSPTSASLAALTILIAGITTACSSSPDGGEGWGGAASGGSSGGSSTGSSGSSSGTDGGGSANACDIGGANGGTCTPGSTAPYVPCVTGAALQSPAVSFSKDVQPIFERSCAVSGSCHQPPANSSVASLVLGMPDGSLSAATVLAAIVNKPAAEQPEMAIVTAGDPTNSYLMHKLDGDRCQFASKCNAAASAAANTLFGDCGVQMPFNAGVLAQGERDQIRRWIAQGAQAN